ncbi:MAG: hypothetical protein ACPIOQ_36210, partial [Promethearchaeia archaeon]
AAGAAASGAACGASSTIGVTAMGGGVTPADARAFPVAGLVMGLGRGRFVEEGPPLSRRLTASVRALPPGDALARKGEARVESGEVLGDLRSAPDLCRGNGRPDTAAAP